MLFPSETDRVVRRPKVEAKSVSPRTAHEAVRPSDRRILSLQLAAGNSTTQSFIESVGSRPSAPIVVSRYDTGEHAQFGGGGDVKVRGVFISQGELIAMGDFFERPEDILRAPKAELRQIVTLIRRARAADEGKPGAKPVKTEEWNDATDGRYIKLAKKNTKHFAPKHGTKGKSGADHRGEFRHHHMAAIEIAHAHAGSDRKVPGNALVYNGFAGHFLTDAFSAGHLVDKAGLNDIAKRKFNAQKTTGLVIKENAFTEAVARRVLGDSKVQQKLSGLQLKVIAWGPFSTTRFSEVLFGMSEKKPEAFFSAFAKLVHDGLNEAIANGAGVEVENARGDKWQLAGDETLALSPKTKALARAAVVESNENLELAARTYGPLDYGGMIDAVWAYTPRPTKTGVSQIRTVAKKFADPSNPATVEAFSQMAIREIDTAIAELKHVGRVRREPRRHSIPIGSCFSPHTAILLASGKVVPIADVHVGDSVVGYDLALDRPVEHHVTATHAHPSVEMLSLTLTGDSTPLEVTAEHPIWSEDRNDWIAAGELNAGERLLRVVDGGKSVVKVAAIAAFTSVQDVHNLTVTGAHNYVAGGVLVHNKGP
jgi:hypothetical protein